MGGRFLFLGTSASLGIPCIGCSCVVCTSGNPRNKRLRPSGVVSVAGKRFLLDAGPDFRTQALRAKIERLDGVLITHCHFDHIGGLDDLRVFSFIQNKQLPCLLSQASLEELRIRYHYLIHPHAVDKFAFQVLEGEFGRAEFVGTEWEYVSYFQAGMQVTGYRFGDFAYISDIREYGQALITALKGVKMLVVSALRYTPTKVHFSVDEAVAFAGQIGAERTWLTHVAHDLEHERVSSELPKGVALAYDGLEIAW